MSEEISEFQKVCYLVSDGKLLLVMVVEIVLEDARSQLLYTLQFSQTLIRPLLVNSKDSFRSRRASHRDPSLVTNTSTSRVSVESAHNAFLRQEGLGT